MGVVLRVLRIFTIWVLLLMMFAPVALATTEGEVLPILAFREVKIKEQDFIVLQANADAVNLGEYWLGYSSSDLLDQINPEYQLAEATIDKGQSVILVNDDLVPTCDAVYAMGMPMDLAETKGSVALWHRLPEVGNQLINYERIDAFTWTNSAKGTADIIRPTVVEEGMALPTWFRRFDLGSMKWEVGNLRTDELLGCVIETKVGEVAQVYTEPIEVAPPAIIQVTAETNSDAEVEQLTSNQGLAAPQITEILPNPTGTGTDATNEFIELYNPNSVPYDLSGYVIQTGLTTKHTYIVPNGTLIGPQSYLVFFSEKTRLSMSNTGGQVALVGADGSTIASSDPYYKAADGQAWALAEETWFWSTKPTPGAMNVITEEVGETLAAATTAKTTQSSSLKIKKATASKAKATTKTATTKKATAAKSTKKAETAKSPAKTAQTKVASSATTPNRTIHPLMLAVVALGAVGYGLYEYRHDVANAFHKFRTNRATRRSHRD